ncbi:Serine/threonine-protein kinase PrkC [Botrimarina colliarenosi]|uniref:Serine/threonine-protein kinase PrkC n=1 Tax=Botrimarina colliarenosi TaxID=2528001 RepID=A0A5C6AER6_9BACT|nr:serine/threonine-protein kinase [Botrimarina colliarenosi]TWT97907.1 Serine/threonine-protein kinase PrkC [Botrimarina colliarenosi]
MDPAPSHEAPSADSPFCQVEPTLRLDDLLEACLERLAEVAPLDDARRLREFLPPSQPQHTPFLLAELVKLDMAAAAEMGRDPCLDWYLGALPDLLSADRLPFDLVIEEYQLRRENGHDPKQSEYAERFPQHAGLLGRFSCNAETVAPTAKKPAAPDELVAGDEIDDFVIVQELGSGAFARVYLARQVSMQRLVALKVSAGKGDEPRALAQFDHPNIVRVYDQRALNDGTTHLLYMQYLPGGTLADVVKRVQWAGAAACNGGVLLDAVDDNLLDAAQQPPESSTLRTWLAEASWPVTVAWIGVQLARALDDSHRRGVFHRDVKPANVLISAEGIPKLADFNVSFAGAAGRAGAAATLGGSIGYMAPEHLAAIGGLPGTDPSDVAERADLYSLAVLLWELWQGRRPFDVTGTADSWTDALALQIVSRESDLVEPTCVGHSSEGVLEQTLRETLNNSPNERPESGAELAGRLQLALHPEAAALFDPPPCSWRRKALAAPSVLVIASAVLLPNIAAGLFNYFYNDRNIVENFSAMKGFFVALSTTVNCIAFPVGGVLAAYYGLPVARSIGRAKQGGEATPAEIDNLFRLCHRGALLGGVLWGIASLVFPIALSLRFPTDFPLEEAAHFCLSLLICGGVASVYPYFLLVTLASAVYYPRLVRRSMTDAKFDKRGEYLRRHGELYLFAAAIIPLLAIVLLVSRDDVQRQKDMVVYGVMATFVGLYAAFSAYRYVLQVWGTMAPVLSQQRSSAAPGLDS